MARLPIFDIEGEIIEHLRQANRLVLTAPTGSGKTTQAPQMLLRHGVVEGQVWVLQPRRLATRMVALRVAREMGCAPGQDVGYQTRHERRVSGKTRLLFMTEGIFLRRLQSDPSLRGVGAVVLDEFHERSLDADVALGLVRRLQEKRPELRLLVMSATLDAGAVSQALDCAMLNAQGRVFPVEIGYLDREPAGEVWDMAAGALRGLLDADASGDVLIFMPGAYEIRRTMSACRGMDAALFPLHGSLSATEQDAAVGPCDRRKVIVATNVAETSLTIPGVRHVIDSGQVRLQRFDPRRGINALLVESISKASAEQRAGRAGRTAPGTCQRLWTRAAHDGKPDQTDAEIKRLDLAEAVLRLKALGVMDVRAFPWLDQPDEGALARALVLLADLDALGPDGALTDMGRQMAVFPAHPRVGRMLVAAGQYGCVARAVLWAAIIGERDILSRPLRPAHREPGTSDLAVHEQAFAMAQRVDFDARFCAEAGLVASACRDVAQAAEALRSACEDVDAQKTGDEAALAKSVLTGFFDRVALLKDADTRACALPGLRRVDLDRESAVREPGLVVALDVREVTAENGVRTVLSLAQAIAPEWLEEAHPNRIEMSSQPVWNAATKAVEQVEIHAYNGLVYDQVARPDVDPALAAPMLVDRIRSGELALEKWDDEADHWITRVRCVIQWFPERELIAYDDDDIRVILHEIVAGATRYSQIRNRAVLPYLQQALDWADRQFVEAMAPVQIPLSGGFRMKVRYREDGPPVGRAKIQDLYDVRETPRVAGGRQKVLLEILGPNFRPVQVTEDLAGFWARTYPELKNALKRRYPKHEWR